MASNLEAMPSNLEAMASSLRAMASNLEAMPSNLRAMASNLEAMASNLLIERYIYIRIKRIENECPQAPRLGWVRFGATLEVPLLQPGILKPNGLKPEIWQLLFQRDHAKQVTSALRVLSPFWPTALPEHTSHTNTLRLIELQAIRIVPTWDKMDYMSLGAS